MRHDLRHREPNIPVFTLGAVCVIAAVVGGGLKAAGSELPQVNSLLRQSLLAAVGIALVLLSATLLAVLGRDDGDGRTTRVAPEPISSPPPDGPLGSAPFDADDEERSQVTPTSQQLYKDLRSRELEVARLKSELSSLGDFTPDSVHVRLEQLQTEIQRLRNQLHT